MCGNVPLRLHYVGVVENDRLSLLAPELAVLLAEHGGRLTLIAACRLAAAAAGLHDGRAAHALEALSLAGPDPTLAEVSQQLADEYDEAAWVAQDDADYECFFRRARAAAALAFAHSGDAGDAVYEAAHALGDTEQFANALGAALSP